MKNLKRILQEFKEEKGKMEKDKKTLTLISTTRRRKKKQQKKAKKGKKSKKKNTQQRTHNADALRNAGTSFADSQRQLARHKIKTQEEGTSSQVVQEVGK